MTVEALKGIEGVTSREAERAKNFFALGLMSWLYGRPTEGDARVHRDRSSRSAPEIARGERAGVQGRATTTARRREDFAVSLRGRPGEAAPGHLPADHRQHRRSRYGLVAAVEALRAARSSSAPTRSRPPRRSSRSWRGTSSFGVRTFQAEDEIAAVGAALGAAFGGSLGVTPRPGPGIVLKAETIGLAVTLELPLLILDIQRAGPSTGMPTKPEQADLLMVLFGRNSESPGAR